MKTGQFALITERVGLLDNSFLHYIGIIEGREGQYALYDADIELECLPQKKS